MIYFLFAYFMIGSFMAGAFYEFNDKGGSTRDIALYFGIMLIGGIALLASSCQLLIKFINKQNK